MSAFLPLRLPTFFSAFLVAAGLLFSGILPSHAQEDGKALDAKEVVMKSGYTVERLLSDPDYIKLKSLMEKAKGVLISPSLIKGGFFFGAEGGNGILLARNDQGQWSAPAFFTLGSLSFGLQFGLEDSEVIFAIMTDRGLDSIINQKVKLGVDASVAVGPVGIGGEAATTAQLADLYSFSRARGLFAGVSFEGAVIYGRDDLNEAFYGAPATTSSIVIDRQQTSPAADTLRNTLDKYSQ